MALEQDIKDLLIAWQDNGILVNAKLIFMCVSKIDAKVFFNAKESPLKRTDSRIRRIPFSTRKPTYEETRRVVRQLARTELWHGAREYQNAIHSHSHSHEKDEQHQASTLAIPRHLDHTSRTYNDESVSVGSSPLHHAAITNDTNTIKSLLLLGANPCSFDTDGRVPYMLAETRMAKLAFIRYRQSFPKKWDYEKARIPKSWNEERKSNEQQLEEQKSDKEHAMESMRQNLQSVQITTAEESKGNLNDAEDSALASVMRQRKSKNGGGGGSAGAMMRAKERREAKARLAKEKEEQARNSIEKEKQQELQRRREMMAAAAERRLQGGNR